MSTTRADLLTRVTADGRTITLLINSDEDRETAALLLERLDASIAMREPSNDLKHSAMTFGFWEVVVRPDGDLLDVWELEPDGQTLVRGATRALRFWREQRAICDRYGAVFEPLHLRQMIVTSVGVADGEAVQGVRYPSPPHMSGWWITTDQYNGDIKTLIVDHAFHLVSQRPDLVPFLALPAGYRFDFKQFEDVWFDEAIVKLSK